MDMSVFFSNQFTSAVKLGYRDQYHSDIGDDLLFQLGQPDNSMTPGSPRSTLDDIFQWKTTKGQVLLKKDLEQGEEPVLLWLATKRG